MSWTHAPAAKALLTQANERWPGRNRASDGSIGDAAHSSRTSDHNPRPDGVVMATDVTHDPSGGPDIHAEVRRIAARRDPRVKYIISAGQIWSTARAAEGWRTYTGANGHHQHAHVSIAAGHENDTSPWYDAAPEPTLPPTITYNEDDMRIIKAPNDAHARIEAGTFMLYPQDTEADNIVLFTDALMMLGEGRTVQVVSYDQWNYEKETRARVKRGENSAIIRSE